MTLAIVVFVPEGIVLASDSRQSLSVESRKSDGQPGIPVETVNSDSVYKTFLIDKGKQTDPWQVGISTFGQDMVGNVSIASHLTKFSEERLHEKETVGSVAQKILEYFSSQFPGANVGFHIAGYNVEKSISVPYVYSCSVEHKTVKQTNRGPGKEIIYGATWSGQTDILSSIVSPSFTKVSNGTVQEVQKPPIFWAAMPLQDAIDFAMYAIRTTIDTIRFQARPKNVGGPIDVLVITPETGALWIQKKRLHG